MFRRLRERLAEELEAQATRFPGGQHAFNNSPGGRSTDSATKSQDETSAEDLITLSDSPSVVVPYTSPQQFSIGDDDGFPSESSTPQRKQASNSDADQYYTPNTSTEQQSTPLPEVQNILPTYTPSKKSFYVPQSDIESEVEEPPTLKLDGISMDQLSATNEVLKAKLYKYKDKYTKTVQAYKEMNEEKKKIEHTLTECQDKALRRIAELKEQCHLEQKAKAHLEENLRIYLEEKEEMINVLQTKIQLLKEGRDIDASEVPVLEKENPPDEENLSSHSDDENSLLRDKIKKLQTLLEKCKETIVSNKEQMTQLMKEKESIAHMLEARSKELEEMKARENHSQSELEAQLQSLQSRLTELEQQQAESAMSMAETKKNMHEELEIKEQQLNKAKDDIKQLQHAVDHERHLSAETKKQHEETIDKLQNKLKVTERLMEEEKQNLMQELSRGKAAAVALMQQECAKKLYAVEAEWKDRLKESEIQSEKFLREKETELNEVISQKEVELQNLQHDFEKQRLTAEELERQNEKLNETVENLRAGAVCESAFVEKMNCLKAEHLREIEEKTQLISDLEYAKQNLCSELDNFKMKVSELQNEVVDSQQSIVSLKEELKSCESVIIEKDAQIENIRSTIHNAEEKLRSIYSFASLEAEQLSLQPHISHESGNELSQLLHDNDNVIKLVFENNKEMKQKINTLLKEKETAEQNLSEINMALSDMEVLLKASEDKCAELRHDLKEKSEIIMALQETHQRLEVEDSELHERCRDLEEKVRILEENESLVKELEGKIEEETRMGIENASKHNALLGSFLKTVQLLGSELQNATVEAGENQVSQTPSENLADVSIGELCDEEEQARDLDASSSELEQKLNERSSQAVIIRNQMKSYEKEIKHLKSMIRNFERISQFLYDRIKSSESLCSQMLIQKESDSSEISRLQELLNEVEGKVSVFHNDAQRLKGAFEETRCKCESLENQNANLIEEINLLQINLSELKHENEDLTAAIEVFRNTSDDSKEAPLVAEISSLHQSLIKTREERNNLSAVLLSIEQEMGMNNNSNRSETSSDVTECRADNEFPSGNPADKDYVKRMEEMKVLIKDLQYRETEQSNLLERTRNDYENQIKQINMKVQEEIKTLNMLTEKSSSELECLREQFAGSQKEYEEKIEHLNNKLNTKSDELAVLMEDLKCKTDSVTLLEDEVRKLQDTLAAREAAISVLGYDKSDLESEIAELKENFERQEYELKTHHNHMLTDLRDQTKQMIDKLNAQINELSEALKDQESKHEALIADLISHHQLQINEMKDELSKLEDDNRFMLDTEEKLRNLQNSLDVMVLQVEATNLQKEKEMEAKLAAQEESREWETKFKGLSLQMLSASAAHMEDCTSLRSVIDQKEGQIKTCKEKLASVNLELQTLREKLNELTEEFVRNRQDYEVQMQSLVNSVKETEVLASGLLQRLSHAENALARKAGAFQKVKDQSEEKWKNKIACVSKKFVDQLKNQQEKYKIKLQELQLLLKENAALKASVKEKESSLAKKENSVQECCAEMSLKDMQIEDLQNVLIQKEDAVALGIREKEELLNTLAHTEKEKISLNQMFEEFQIIYRSYASDELSPTTLSSFLSRLNAECEAHKNKCLDLENALSSQKSDFSHEMEVKDQHIENIRNELNNVLGELNSLERDCRAFQEENNSLKEQNKTISEENEDVRMKLEEEIVDLKSLLSEVKKRCTFLETKLQNLEDECSVREKGYWEKISDLSSENEKFLKEKMSAVEEWKKKMGDSKKKAEAKLEEIKKQMHDEKIESLECAESAYKEEFKRLTEKISALETEKKKCERKKVQEVEDVKHEMNKKLDELRNELTLQLQAKDEQYETVVLKKNQLHTDCSILQESVKDKENIILQLKSTVSSLEKDHLCKIEELSSRIKQLELEREHLMLQAQERVAATEAKCRENINSLTEKISELQLKEREIENLKSDIEKLNSQLDESLIVAEANQSAAAQELSILKAHVSASQKELEDAVSTHSLREAELLSQVKSLEEDILCLQSDKMNLEDTETEKVVLLEKLQSLEEKTKSDSLVLDEVLSLKETNERLQNEVDSLVALQKDNEMLAAKVHSLESNEKDLHEKLNQLESANAELRTSASSSVKQTSDKDSSELHKERTQLQDENRALLDKVRVLEESVSSNSDASFKEYIDLIKRDYEGKLSAKDAEMESKLKQIIKDFAAQMNVKEKDYDEILSEVMEKCQSQEGKLLREHRIEIASLRQEIFEKDCALEEMHDHYEEIVKEKDAKLKEHEKKHGVISSSVKSGTGPANMGNETSDWDDNWVECEENCDDPNPVLGNKGDCATHVQQIHMLQEELEKSNSEVKDLRVLLRLSPPQSLASNNDSKSSSLLLPEPTEFEYLKNILFEYMMGKEPLTLVKVIAAVLRFSDEQTKLVLKKEELKQTMKTHWLGLNS